MEVVYNQLGCQAQLQGHLDEAERQRAWEEIKRGELLVRYGAPESWIIQRTIGRLHLLREEYAEAIPCLLAVRRYVTGRNRFVDDRALIRAYNELGEHDRARAIALDGVALGPPYSRVYLDLLSTIPSEPADVEPARGP
jgi:hypothetical protein